MLCINIILQGSVTDVFIYNNVVPLFGTNVLKYKALSNYVLPKSGYRAGGVPLKKHDWGGN